MNTKISFILFFFILLSSCEKTEKLQNTQNYSYSIPEYFNAEYNIIIILCDDLGWSDLGCYGNDFIETRNIDWLAENGTRFTQAYASAPVCSPSRASILTGLVPFKTGINDYLRPSSQIYLKQELPTLSKILKRAGYKTGIIGKWHLSGYSKQGGVEIDPKDHGFDEVILSESIGIGEGSYKYPYHFNDTISQRIFPVEYLIDRVNLETSDFIERNKKKSFFLYISHYAVHSKVIGADDLVKKYETKINNIGESSKLNVDLAAQIESIDIGIGHIIYTLKQNNILEKTIIIFTSDNGGDTFETNNKPLRAGKSFLYEGGIRIPLIVFSELIGSNKINNSPVIHYDLAPTILSLIGLELEKDFDFDGVDIFAYKNKIERFLFWHYPIKGFHALGGYCSSAIRGDNFKLHLSCDGEIELYDISLDLGEENEISRENIDITVQLKDKLQDFKSKTY